VTSAPRKQQPTPSPPPPEPPCAGSSSSSSAPPGGATGGAPRFELDPDCGTGAVYYLRGMQGATNHVSIAFGGQLTGG